MGREAEFDRLIEQAASTRDKLFYAGLRLFADKGYANVGIRELCGSVNIKESSFYNHYRSKDSLFEAIIAFFDATTGQAIMTDDEIEHWISLGDVKAFLIGNMNRFTAATSNLLFFTALQIVLTESYVNKAAAAVAKRNVYHLRKDYTERILRGLMEQGAIRQCDTETVTAEYYYALKGMLDEYLLLELWNEDMTEINERIRKHIAFFARLLDPEENEGGNF
ncbi:MAG: TetR/AcrR family transcriptional regulator [Clostridiales bacterium]|nr:TetR/AcrR family transcriptional regulator [Clostridiales bacterium]